MVSAYTSQAKDGELIALEPKGRAPEGHYILLQKNNQGLSEDEQQLHVAEFEAFGRYSGKLFTECEGLHQPQAVDDTSVAGSTYAIKRIFTDGGKPWLAKSQYTGHGFTLKLSACTLGVAGVHFEVGRSVVYFLSFYMFVLSGVCYFLLVGNGRLWVCPYC